MDRMLKWFLSFFLFAESVALTESFKFRGRIITSGEISESLLFQRRDSGELIKLHCGEGVKAFHTLDGLTLKLPDAKPTFADPEGKM